MTFPRSKPAARAALGALLIASLGGCSALRATATPAPVFYALAGADATPAGATPTAATERAPVLVVNPPHAASGFDSRRMIYVRTPPQLEYFARSEWVDTPARMLAPLLVAAIAQSAAFRAVVGTAGSASGELRLDTELVRLQQEFGATPSRVRLTLRATLVDSASRRVLAWREFDSIAVAASDDPRGGALAAADALARLLADLRDFCADSAAAWRATSPVPAAPRLP